MTARKMQLLMSKYGFSITIMLAELFYRLWFVSLSRSDGSDSLDYPSYFDEYSNHCIDC